MPSELLTEDYKVRNITYLRKDNSSNGINQNLYNLYGFINNESIIYNSANGVLWQRVGIKLDKSEFEDGIIEAMYE